MKFHGALLWLLLLLAAGCGGSTLSSGASRRERWLEVVTPHFVLHTDLHEPAARDVARTLEEMRAALLQLAWTGAREPPRGRMDVVVFRSPGEFNRHVASGRVLSGVAMSRPGERKLLSFHAGQGSGVPRVIIHELAHAISAWFMPLQPSWFAEGFAGYLENTTYDRDTGVAVLGRLSQDYQSWLRASGAILSSKDLFAASTPPHDGPYSGSYFYSSAWLLVHYLLNQESESFGEFQRRLGRLQDWRSAWVTAFPGLSHEQLDQRVVAYAARMQFETLSGPLRLPAYEPQVRVLSDAEAHGTRARVARSGNPQLARREADEALRLDPNELGALRARFSALDEQATRERLELGERAVAAHPRRAEAWWLLARASIDAGTAAAAVERAHQLDPEHPGVALAMAESLLQRGDASAALPFTRLAVRAGAPDRHALAVHLQALAGTRNCERALQLQPTVEGLTRSSCSPDGSASCASALQSLAELMQPCASAQLACLDTASSQRPAHAAGKGGKSPAAVEAQAITGRIAPEVIRSVVRSHYSAFRACYELGLVRAPELQGRITMRFVIDRAGKVSSLSIADVTLRDCGVIDCIRAAFGRIEFPRPENGIVTVSYPLMLQPGD